ncbi:MAG: ATP-binding protein, partial [Bacteroidetes bacterium]|nr:ATP-binding protein [Bacteroidota bacterium]
LHLRQAGWPEGYSYHVQATDDDRLWVSFYSQAIAVFDIRRNSRPDADLPLLQIVMPVAGLPDPDPFCFVIDRRFRLWTKIRISDAAVLDVRKSPVPLRLFQNFHSDIRTLYEDEDGTIWLGGYNGGVFFYDDSLLQRPAFHRLADPAIASVRAFCRDRRGRMWIGTMDGLLVETATGWRTFDTRTGLPNNRVGALAQGPDGRMWIGTQTGIVSLREDLGAIYRYPGFTDSPISACGVQKDGFVWVATAFGLTFYDRTRSHHDTTPPVVRLSAFAVNGSPRPYVNGVQLSHTDNNVRVDVAAIRLRNAREVRYQYRFPDIDSTWSTPSFSRSLSFPALQPGFYLIEIRALTAELVPSREPLSLRFTVTAPFWQRWWFYPGVLLLVGLAVALLYRLRLQRLLAAERLRTQIAADLHDDIGSGLTRIAMLSDVMLQQTRQRSGDSTTASPPEQLWNTITRTGTIARELVESMSDVVWSLDPRNDTVGQLADRLRVFANDLADGAEIRLNFMVSDPARQLRLHAEISRALLLVIKEALNNVVRHAAASNIHVRIDTGDSVLRFVIEDDGAGFDTAAPSRRSGLAHMEQRVTSCGGTLRIISAPGGGTRIEGSIPLGRKN